MGVTSNAVVLKAYYTIKQRVDFNEKRINISLNILLQPEANDRPAPFLMRTIREAALSDMFPFTDEYMSLFETALQAVRRLTDDAKPLEDRLGQLQDRMKRLDEEISNTN